MGYVICITIRNLINTVFCILILCSWQRVRENGAIETEQLTKFLQRQAKMVTQHLLRNVCFRSEKKNSLCETYIYIFLNNLGKHVFPQSHLCRAYKSCGPGGPPHVKIVVEWDKETKE